MPGDSPLVSYYRQAKKYGRGPRAKGPIRLVVIHTEEAPWTANQCIDYFAINSDNRDASTHYAIDESSVAQGVRESDIAWTAPGANHDGINIEQKGYAHWTRAEWLDAGTTPQIQLLAKLCAELCSRYKLPVVFLDAAALKTGVRGITTHAQVSLAYKRSGHMDPGKNFPMDKLTSWTKQEQSGGIVEPSPPSTQEGHLLYFRHPDGSIWQPVGEKRIKIDSLDAWKVLVKYGAKAVDVPQQSAFWSRFKVAQEIP